LAAKTSELSCAPTNTRPPAAASEVIDAVCGPTGVVVAKPSVDITTCEPCEA
jgi:hypothetical protein